ncbi:unnamed protein product [Clonostachys chloroleuca]|uniref:F-box domain-containing protein n=1 Tax=Clonostachys chloroleuca TaxID=1926264 RepID=A0AA35M9E0_9HYPO|nr:unnamed protein product [Clonostachys chloroleuca]
MEYSWTRHTRDTSTLILDLPDEILVRIIKAAILPRGDSGPKSLKRKQYDKDVIAILASVCQRFACLAVPFNYHSIRFEWPTFVAPPSHRVRLLRDTLINNPSLGHYCQDFWFYISDFTTNVSPADFDVLIDLIGLLPDVKVLGIHGGFSLEQGEYTWESIRNCVQLMRRLEYLVLSREALAGLTLGPIMKELQIPSLRKLRVDGISQSDSWHSETLEEADFTELDLSDYRETAEALACLLKWPRRLTHFRLGSYYNNTNYIDLPMFRPMLLRHRDSLVKLDIGYLAPTGRGTLLDLSDFKALKELKLSRWQIGPSGARGMLILEFKPGEVELLLAPKLEKFALSFALCEKNMVSWSDFGHQEQYWLQCFMEIALAKRSSLREVLVLFSPHNGDITADTYPWDRIISLHNAFEPRGIIVTHSPPSLSREEWMKEAL